MRRLRCCATLMAAILLVMSPAAGHGAKEPPQSTVTGEIVDLASFLGHGVHGDENAEITGRAIANGQPMGLLMEDGTLYVLYKHHHSGTAYDVAKQLAGRVADITGVLSERNGVKGIEVCRAAASHTRERRDDDP